MTVGPLVEPDAVNINPGEGYADSVYASPGEEKRSPYNQPFFRAIGRDL